MSDSIAQQKNINNFPKHMSLTHSWKKNNDYCFKKSFVLGDTFEVANHMETIENPLQFSVIVYLTHEMIVWYRRLQSFREWITLSQNVTSEADGAEANFRVEVLCYSHPFMLFWSKKYDVRSRP